MRALLLLTVANIKSFTRDRAALFWTLAFPLIFVVLFGSIFSGGSNDRSIGFADLDGDAGIRRSSTAAFAAVDGVKLVDGDRGRPPRQDEEGRAVARSSSSRRASGRPSRRRRRRPR